MAIGLIGRGLYIKGELHGEDDLIIEGAVEGTITMAKSLTIETEGRIKADIETENVTVKGVMEGDVNQRVYAELTLPGDAAVGGELQQDVDRWIDRDYRPEKQHGWLVCGLHPGDGNSYRKYAVAEYLAGYSGPPPMVHLRRGDLRLLEHPRVVGLDLGERGEVGEEELENTSVWKTEDLALMALAECPHSAGLPPRRGSTRPSYSSIKRLASFG